MALYFGALQNRGTAVRAVENEKSREPTVRGHPANSFVRRERRLREGLDRGRRFDTPSDSGQLHVAPFHSPPACSQRHAFVVHLTMHVVPDHEPPLAVHSHAALHAGGGMTHSEEDALHV